MNFDEQIAIERARENKVVKDNKLIQTVTRNRYSLTAVEQKMIGFIVSMIKPPEEPGAAAECTYVFDIPVFCKVCGIDYTSGGNYKYIKEALDKLAANSFWIRNNGKQLRFQWITTPEINENSGKIEIEIPRKIIPYLYDLKEKFTSYELYQILALKSSYSIRLYELLASYEFTKKHTFEIDEIKNLLQCPYKDYKDFRRYALEPAIKEINEYTNLEATWEAKTRGRKVVAIEFRMKRKKQLESYEAYRKTMAELNGVKHQNGQLNLFEFME